MRLWRGVTVLRSPSRTLCSLASSSSPPPPPPLWTSLRQRVSEWCRRSYSSSSSSSSAEAGGAVASSSSSASGVSAAAAIATVEEAAAVVQRVGTVSPPTTTTMTTTSTAAGRGGAPPAFRLEASVTMKRRYRPVVLTISAVLIGMGVFNELWFNGPGVVRESLEELRLRPAPVLSDTMHDLAPLAQQATTHVAVAHYFAQFGGLDLLLNGLNEAVRTSDDVATLQALEIVEQLMGNNFFLSDQLLQRGLMRSLRRVAAHPLSPERNLEARDALRRILLRVAADERLHRHFQGQARFIAHMFMGAATRDLPRTALLAKIATSRAPVFTPEFRAELVSVGESVKDAELRELLLMALSGSASLDPEAWDKLRDVADALTPEISMLDVIRMTRPTWIVHAGSVLLAGTWGAARTYIAARTYVYRRAPARQAELRSVIRALSLRRGLLIGLVAELLCHAEFQRRKWLLTHVEDSQPRSVELTSTACRVATEVVATAAVLYTRFIIAPLLLSMVYRVVYMVASDPQHLGWNTAAE